MPRERKGTRLKGVKLRGDKMFKVGDKIEINEDVEVEVFLVADTTALSFTLVKNADGVGYYQVKSLPSVVPVSDTLIIPDTYNGRPVTHIKDGAFQNCTTITSVCIPDSVTTIGTSVFYGCTSLKKVTIPSSVTKIGEWTFAYCSAIETIDLPNDLTEINDFLFEKCTGLKNIVIPDKVTYVGYSFYGCTSLESVTFGKGVVDVYFDAFGNSSVSTLIFRGDVIPHDESLGGTYISHLACINALKTVIIEGNVTAIRENEFRGCSLLETVVLPEGILTIGQGAFYECFALKNLNIPSSVTSIGNHAFYECESLLSIKILKLIFKKSGAWLFGV